MQYALASHSASLVHEVAHAGGVWVALPVQNTGRYGPQSLAWVPAVHAESLSTSWIVPHTLPTQVATSDSPSHAVGDVHTGGELHSYPFLADPDLACAPDLAHSGTFTLDVVLDDPGGLVDPDHVFRGTYTCLLDGADVTPGDGTWRVRASRASDRVIADGVPVGAVCSVDE